MINNIKKLNNQHVYPNNHHELIPAIVQHVISGDVLMLGYMNKDSINHTKNSGYVTFFSRKKNCLWIKGETSGNKLQFIDMYQDCDEDALLILSLPHGPTCHKNSDSCFFPASSQYSFLFDLEKILLNIKKLSLNNIKTSYTLQLFSKGSEYIAQKVGEESIEVILASLTKNKENVLNESADLIYHLLVLLHNQSLSLSDVINKLKIRNKKKLKK